MWNLIQRLSLAIFLIIGASAILLLSDVPRPKHQSPNSLATETTVPQKRNVAIFQMASQIILDEGVAGIILSLKDAGFVDGETMKLSRFNAEGDLATSNAIAQELVSGDYELLITVTTGALQAVANANQNRKIPHVFGLVSDPIKAGVGIGTEPLDHPDHLVGIGTFPPVDQALALAKKMSPKLSRIGLAWNPAEINSEVCTLLARKTCKELNLNLLEANVESSGAVKEAVASLIARQADALLIGGDVTMLGMVDVVSNTAREAHLPVFTCIPGNAAKGALFDVGANYFEVGRTTGRVAARVLNGESIAKIPVEMAIPPKLFLNQLVAKDLHGNWQFPADVIRDADTIIDETGQHEKKSIPETIKVTPSSTATPKQPTKRWEIRMIAYVNTTDVEDAERGLREGLKKSGLVETRDFVLKSGNAQGDMAILNGLVDSAFGDNADLVMTMSTQALQSAAARSRGTPVVFTMVVNPFLAGVGKSESDHLPHVTGAYGTSDVQKMMPIIRELLPNARRIGSMYAPGEVNSVYSFELLSDAAKANGYEVISTGVNSASEVPDAIQSLCDQRVDLLCFPSSNITGTSYPIIAQVAARAKIPIFGFLGSFAAQGAVVVLTRDHYDMAIDAGQIAGRVIRGEKPAAIPFFQCTKSKLLFNTASANACNINIPESLLKSADKTFNK